MCVSVAAMCLSVSGFSQAADAGSTDRIPTHIPGQPLGSALQSLAKERGLQLVYVTEEVGELRTAGAIGSFTSDEALATLLEGTGLTFKYLDDRTVTIVLAAAIEGEAASEMSNDPPAVEYTPVMPALEQAPQASSTRSIRPRSAIVAALLALTGVKQVAAQTQDAATDAPEEVGEVLVTGYRASLQGALEVKRNSELVVDAISGGDIGALPDVTIAESLVRLPGVNGTRDRGNQSQAALRGLGPRLVLGLVNGREVASSEPSRNVRWEIYPSEVVAGADVYKAQSADLVAGGVAGTIDIKTIKPLEYDGPAVQLRGGPVYYEAGSDIPGYDPYGYRGSAGITQMVGDDFGFNLGVSLQQQKNAFPSFQGWGYNDGSINPGNLTGDIDGDGTADPTPWGAQTEVKKLTEDRYGLNGAFGWRVGDNFELNVDALYSKFTIDEDQNQAWYGRNGTTGNWDNGSAWCYNNPGSSYTTVNGAIVAATLDDCFASVTNVIAKYTEDKDLFVSGANLKVTSGAWTTSVDLSRSKATRENRWAAFRSEVYPETMTFDMAAGNTPSLIVSSDPADPAGQSAPDWLPGQSDGPDSLKDRLTALRFDVTREFEGEHLRSLHFGARYSDREKNFFRRQQFYAPIVAGNLPASLFSSYRVSEFDAPPLLNGSFREIIDAAYGGMPVDDDAIMQSSIWGVEEDVAEYYGKVRFGGSVGSVPFSGNAGVRWVSTNTRSTGFSSTNGGALEPVRVTHDYTEALPSVNLTFNLADDRLLRVGLARVIARPPLDELRASRSLWNDTPPPTGSGGNPTLDPFVANQADISYEWYFRPEALVSLALFYKDVDSHIGYTTQPVTIDSITYAVTGPFSGEGGGITGAEFTFQTPFSGAFEDFGVYMNYAYVDTDVREFYPVTNPLPIEGYAQDTAALDLWYGRGGFEARLGYKYHSPFTVIAGWNGSDVRTLDEETILDFSTSWQVSDHFGVRLQINNLTDGPLRITRDNDPNRLGSYDVYGRRALLDFTFKF
jgi:iron complex outermembrane receptor protein